MKGWFLKNSGTHIFSRISGILQSLLTVMCISQCQFLNKAVMESKAEQKEVSKSQSCLFVFFMTFFSQLILMSHINLALEKTSLTCFSLQPSTIVKKYPVQTFTTEDSFLRLLCKLILVPLNLLTLRLKCLESEHLHLKHFEVSVMQMSLACEENC